MRRVGFALIIAFGIQLPFLVLMTVAGVHSGIGAVWYVFYMPTMWLLDRTGLPYMSPFADLAITALIQEAILLILILSLMALWMFVKSMRKKVP